jgi:hypothetical protein
MAQLFGIYSMPGVAEESDEYSQPLVDCGNATAILPVISIVEANETNAWLDNDCIVLEANEYTTIALKDRIMYAMLGIIG